MTVTFKKPPVNEVVIGKTFDRLEGLTVPYYGRFWELVQDEFPDVEHAPPIATDAASLAAFGQGYPLPRVWFVSADRTRLLQLQEDRFYFNWRQTAQREEYVRFDNLFESYTRYEQLFSAFLLSQLGVERTVRRLDLAYVNVLTRGNEWTEFGDVQNIMAGLSFPSETKHIGRITQGAIHLEYLMPDCPGRLTLNLGSAMMAQEPILRLELAAAVTTADRGDLSSQSWFSAAHEAIVHGFCEITEDKAQNHHWGKG